jgi:hypothetical protein
MLSYPVVDRDRERLVEEFDAASLFAAPPVPAPIRRRLFKARTALGGVIRSHLVSA